MRRAAFLFLVLLPLASAQSNESDPSLNESDFNSTLPEEDTSYLNETDGNATGSGTASGGAGGSGSSSSSTSAPSDPTLSEGDFDTSLPDEDTSYLDQNEAPPARDATAAAATTPPTKGRTSTPGPSLALLAAGLAVAALALRRR